jgi:AcrR family transcriptional regulator
MVTALTRAGIPNSKAIVLFINRQMPRRAVAPDLLDTASRLFEQRGIHAVGVDEILTKSGRSSRSLYQHFGSKEGLAAAALTHRGTALFRMLTEGHPADPPEIKLLGLFDRLGDWFRQPEFRGCAFVKAAGEFADPAHPLRVIAVTHKRAVLAWLKQCAREAGLVSHARLARELFLLIEGAIAAALVLGEPAAAAAARRAAAALIDAHRREYAGARD